MPSASEDPTELEEENRDYGVTVLVLSDAVVVAITPDGPASSIMGQYDLLGFALSEITTAQARCVHRGIFLRGGISHGSFFYENNILISPALACAYELETKYAHDPIIILRQSTLDAIKKVPRMGSGPWGDDPTSEHFKLLNRRYEAEPLYFLDYLKIAGTEQGLRWSPEGHAKYEAARASRDHTEAQNQFNQAAWKAQALYFEHHKNQLIHAYRASSEEKIRKKYRWLMTYHNESVPGTTSPFENASIDLGQFQPNESTPDTHA